MSAQLDLWAPAQRNSVQPKVETGSLLGRGPMSVTHSSYQPFDGELARAAIIEMCAAADGWVKSRDIYRSLRMHPGDLSCLARGMEERGEIESTELYYGASDPREKNYRGFHYGYRLPEGRELSE